MEIIDTSKTQIYLNKDTRFSLQNGTNTEGASGGNFPLHVSNFDESPILTEIDTDRSTYCILKFSTSDVSIYDYIKPGDPLQLIRGNIKRSYVCENINIGLTGATSSDMYITLMKRETSDSFIDLDHFVGEYGYPYADSNTTINFNRILETNDKNNLILFNVEFNALEYIDTYSINVNIDFDYTIKNTRLRWRTIPTNQQIPNIDFTLTGTATAIGPVPITVVSDTGRGANLEFVIGATTPYEINTLDIIDAGGGYLSVPVIDIDETNIDGSSTLEITPVLHLNTEGRVDYIRVLNGGSGYTGATVTVSPLSVANGTTASGYAEIENGEIINIVLTNHGYGFTKAGETTVTSYTLDGDGIGAELLINVDTDSNWVYEDPTQEKNITLYNFKRGLSYEIQVVGSDTEIFTGIYKYSHSINFTYY